MKSIKDLKIKTKEGFEVKNLERFPSMEFGPEGGLKADLYYQGNHILNLYQAGNGGCAFAHPTSYYKEHKLEINAQGLSFLKRVDEYYGPNSPYDFLKNKTAADMSDDDWEGIINHIEEYYDDIVSAAKSFKEGYKAVVSMKSDYQTSYLAYHVSDITLEEVRVYMKKEGLDKKYKDIKILLPTPELFIL